MVGQCLHGAHAVSQIPLQDPINAGVVKAGQRATRPARRRTDCGNPGRVEIAAATEGPAGQERQNPCVQTRFVTDLGYRRHAGQVDVGRRADSFGCGDHGRGCVLRLEFGAAEGLVGNLQYADRFAGRAAQQEVGVLLAPQSGGGGLEAEVFGGDRLGLLGRDLRHRQLGGLEEVEQRHER